MKKLIPIIGLLAIGISAPAFAHDVNGMVDKMFEEGDTNHDGYIDKDEFMQMMSDKFDDMDANDDGKLSKSEVIAYKKQEMSKWHKSNSGTHTGNTKHKNASTAPNRPDNTSADQDRSDTSEDAKTNTNSSSNH